MAPRAKTRYRAIQAVLKVFVYHTGKGLAKCGSGSIVTIASNKTTNSTAAAVSGVHVRRVAAKYQAMLASVKKPNCVSTYVMVVTPSVKKLTLARYYPC